MKNTEKKPEKTRKLKYFIQIKYKNFNQDKKKAIKKICLNFFL